jgi:DNA-binding transcriptional MerR regulator/methylmalonyl-CoA mutase cobalamin-binding subunit
MSTASQTPTFNLKAVLQETGLKADTLRAWERRYSLPQPQRSPGGHRLYSQRDIEIIKWLIARQGEGMSISRAVDLWRSLEKEERDPLQMAEYAAPEAVAPVRLPQGGALDELRPAWMSACLAYEEQEAERILAQAFALYPVEVVSLELLQKGLAEIGEGWYRGEISVQQEHFASELAMRRLEALLAAAPPPTRPERILVACPPQEEHTFSALLLALFLRRRGWDVLYLGANVPPGRLETTLATAKPHLVILAAQQLHTAATLLELAHVLHEQHIPLAFGGLIFNLLPELRTRVPGYFLGESLDVAPQMVEQVLSSPPPLPPAKPISEAYQQALAHYRERQASIAAQMRAIETMGIGRDHLTIANTHLALNIQAALALGDMDFLGVDIEWVKGLLGNHRLPDELLSRYLSAYYQAASTQLDERGAPVVNWLQRVKGGDSE